jgi:hypothetical protein
VRLVAGESEDNAGLRVAELCGLPRTLELADLTREIFDLALLGRHSGRRSQVERLLTALGTPVASPQTFGGRTPNGNGGAHGNGTKTRDASGRDDAHAELASVEDLDAALARALPDLSGSSGAVDDAENLPGPEDREALHDVLSEWAARTGARSVVLHVGVGNVVAPISRFGPDDALLNALIHLSLSEDAPHLVSRLEGEDRGKAWGAWPFHTRGLRGALAAARFDPAEGRPQWEVAVQALRVAWERHERDRKRVETAPAAERSTSWLAPETFVTRLLEAVQRHRETGVTFAVHRLRFDESPEAIDLFCADLPLRLRDSDLLCHPRRRDVLFLHQGSPTTFSSLRRRLVVLWEDAWQHAGRPAPAPPILEERVDLATFEDGSGFLETARRWLGNQEPGQA